MENSRLCNIMQDRMLIDLALGWKARLQEGRSRRSMLPFTLIDDPYQQSQKASPPSAVA